MTRLGWGVLAAILLAAAGFALLTDFGGGAMRPVRIARPLPTVAPPADGLLLVPVAGVTRAAIVDRN